MTSTSDIWLSVDTSTPAGSIALHRWVDGRPSLLAEREADSQGNLTEVLIEQIEALLTQAGISLSEVDRFVTTTGPGSFTGLRLALASLKAFAFALEKPLVTVGAPEARWIAAGRPESSVVLTHVTNEKVVVSRFASGALVSEAVERYEALGGETPSVALTDTRVDSKRLPAAWPTKGLPLRARHLTEAASTARSRRDHVSAAEQIALSPDYLGTSFQPNP